MLLTLNYLNLITSEHRIQPRYMSMLEGVFDMFTECGNQIDNISSMMNIDTAVGDQLTLVGKWLGQSRDISKETNGELGVIEDDELYRFLLQARMLQNNWDGTIEGVISIFKSLYEDSILTFVDNQDMTCDIVVVSRMTPEQEILLKSNLILPKPNGVQYEYDLYQVPVFGWDRISDLIGGWDDGHWAEPFN